MTLIIFPLDISAARCAKITDLLHSFQIVWKTDTAGTEAPLGVLGIRDICEKNYRDTGYFGEKL